MNELEIYFKCPTCNEDKLVLIPDKKLYKINDISGILYSKVICDCGEELFISSSDKLDGLDGLKVIIANKATKIEESNIIMY